ncbi:glycine--tRNA ligase, chloroplastic/mitochondrial 2 isoform X2 [Argentina anserina]|uniref:glycine--tRNA ligase, chloroplastic/mitochondrial 2 isoform X2 n=1 Tax=Argentina anserina TaxID=57926 RepID=UPI002176847E|nr:glycine--tRNA ligase, chloroplastic/mitochondrial 2 isoform X2 [Potentilla anserina]
MRISIDVRSHDIRFVEDNWESPVLGAWGLGWEIWMDGMEITQFTYFQQAGSLQLSPVSVEITYGLERILMLLQGVDHFKKIQYADGITYGELFLENEKEMSAYYLEHAGVHHIKKQFDLSEEEARSLLASGLAIPAYDQLLKTSHAFNILDSRGFVGVTERARYFGRMRSLARQCAQLWLKTRESLGYPLGVVSETDNLICPKELVEAAVKKVHDTSRSFVLEIGIEEMPPQDVVDASQQLKDLIVQLLAKQRLGHGEVQAFSTPRRLVVSVGNLCTKQLENDVEVRGPPVSKSFDDQGNPTKAAEGFCRRYSVPLNSLYRKTDGKTKYIYARVVESARLALEVLSEDLPNAIARISFPKSMRWNSQVMFTRPIRWILAMHGDVVVPFTFAQILSGNLSYGLRNTPSATVTVETAESYAGVMRNAGINIEMEERKKKVIECSNTLARSVNGQAFIPDGLLNEVVNLVEAPVPVLGEFKRSFLELPSDLLTMVMQKHQKYFSVRNENGGLLPYFIAVANGAIDERVVRKGNEAVLRARYEDAKFFYEMDTRKSFSEFRSQLKGILFHEKLGTMLEKVQRLENMVGKLTLVLGMDDNTIKIVQHAASLAMSDLATAVVTEFTSLSGVMARHYALRDGNSEQVAEALFEIMLPRFSGDMLPKTDAGIVLSVADRLDSLVGLFAAGCQPSSTNDPFGLRRISYGLVQVLVEKDKYLDLQQALELAADVQPLKVDATTVKDAHQFITRRLEQYLVDKGISSEVVRSVLAERANRPYLAARTACKMEALLKGELFPKVLEAYSRPTRIVRGKDVDPHIEVDEAAFETDEERDLWISFLSVTNKICDGIEVDEFVNISAQLVQPLDDFFNHVFVMVEDERIRKNRLALLKRVADLPRGVADLSILPGF